MNITTEQLFDDARTQNGFLDRAVDDATLRQIYDLMKWGPTSANCSPVRIVFVRSPAEKAKLLEGMAPGNVEKTRSAPVIAIIGMDMAFYDKLGQLFPHTDARAWFAGKPELIEATAFRNSSLQGGYLILAARALGLDCGPMSGFDAAKLDAAFWAGTSVRTNFVCNLGHGDPAKSGFASGFGALATPLMALAIPVPQAAAIMLPLLLVMDAVGLQRLWQERDPALLKLLLPAGLVGTAVGTLLFGVFTTAAVSGVVGALTLLFLAQRLAFPPHAASAPPPKALGFVLGIASGFTSFVAHAGSPPISAYTLSLRLPPIRYAATMAVFFAAVNLSKWLPYAWLGLIDLRNMGTALLLVPLAPLGVWLGVRLTRHIRPTWFYRLAYAGMFLTGVKLLSDGLR